jgi:hypothetical protein
MLGSSPPLNTVVRMRIASRWPHGRVSSREREVIGAAVVLLLDTLWGTGGEGLLSCSEVERPGGRIPHGMFARHWVVKRQPKGKGDCAEGE